MAMVLMVNYEPGAHLGSSACWLQPAQPVMQSSMPSYPHPAELHAAASWESVAALRTPLV